MSDETKLHRLAVMISDDDHITIWDAIRLYHALRDVRGVRSQEQDGKALAAICEAWRAAETARIRGEAKGA